MSDYLTTITDELKLKESQLTLERQIVLLLNYLYIMLKRISEDTHKPKLTYIFANVLLCVLNTYHVSNKTFYMCEKLKKIYIFRYKYSYDFKGLTNVDLAPRTKRM